MKLDLNTLKEYENNGLITIRTHNHVPLQIINYTPKVQFEQLWDDITRQCRGLIIDNEGGVIAKPFGKFFNLEEHDLSEIPNEPFEVFEKLDGSLLIVFYYDGNWMTATRGSFVSDQAIKGAELLLKYNLKSLDISKTYLFEIIY